MGFVIKQSEFTNYTHTQKKNQALVYGKHPEMWDVSYNLGSSFLTFSEIKYPLRKILLNNSEENEKITKSQINGIDVSRGASRFFHFNIQHFRNVTASGVHGPLREIMDPPLNRLAVLYQMQKYDLETKGKKIHGNKKKEQYSTIADPEFPIGDTTSYEGYRLPKQPRFEKFSCTILGVH